MKRKLFYLFLSLGTASLSAQEVSVRSAQEVSVRSAHEVLVSAQIWRYPRIYPLFDGLFQDVAATQLSALSLSANAVNGVNLDALQQSFQMQLQYSQMAGIQNTAAAQTMTANTAYQTSLLGSESQLLQASSAAQSQLASAQGRLDEAKAAATPDPVDIAAATLAVSKANDNITGINNQLAAIKGAIGAPTGVSPASSLTGTLPTPAAIPSAVSSQALSNTPSLPATKQMDNQIGLLWERMSRLVGAMVKPDSAQGELYLLKFDTGLYPHQRKHQTADVSFRLSCSSDGARPTVVDLFPRNAAVNLINTKYRDSSLSLSALLNFFGFGINAAYNREHLRVTQMLGQSSYITGRGIGQSTFGWEFGITLGEDIISPGTRNTFALVQVPERCTPNLSLDSAVWSKGPAVQVIGDMPAFPPLPEAKCVGCIQSVEFNRVEYDPAGSKAANVTVKIALTSNLDQQASITVNGIYVKRARDTFGRAIIGGGGSGGLLEASGIDNAVAWIPAGPRTIILTLDGSQFGEHFPNILISSPTSVISLPADLGTAEIKVSGSTVSFCATCGRTPPSLAVRKPSVRKLAIARWLDNTRPKPDQDMLSITDLDATLSTTAAAAGPGSVQVISDASDQVWGNDVEVFAIDGNEQHLLKCDPPQGPRISCQAYDPNHRDGERPAISLRVLDVHHAGGSPILSFLETRPCGDRSAGFDACYSPLVWKTDYPKIDVEHRVWTMTFQFVNVLQDETVSIGNLAPAAMQCRASGGPCSVTFIIRPQDYGGISDPVDLTVRDSSGNPITSAVLGNIRSNIKPTIAAIDKDWRHWTGQNLLYRQMKIGDLGPIHQIGCELGTDCHVSEKIAPAETGYMYFIAGSTAIPFVQTSATGASTPILVTPPDEKAKTPTKGAANPLTPEISAAPAQALKKRPSVYAIQ